MSDEKKAPEWKVYKYDIPGEGVQHITMPTGAEILSVGWQDGKPVIWCRVDCHAPRVVHAIALARTGPGGAPPPSARFVGTLVHPMLGMVWHVFDGGEVKAADLPAFDGEAASTSEEPQDGVCAADEAEPCT